MIKLLDQINYAKCFPFRGVLVTFSFGKMVTSVVNWVKPPQFMFLHENTPDCNVSCINKNLKRFGSIKGCTTSVFSRMILSLQYARYSTSIQLKGVSCTTTCNEVTKYARRCNTQLCQWILSKERHDFICISWGFRILDILDFAWVNYDTLFGNDMPE